jgi:glycosyltransferase involved in cell wall biosynthesis
MLNRHMTTPTLSVIVPTRERSDTLRHTLRSIVDQDYDDCEIIISDNFSQDETHNVVQSFSDCRIRYLNTGQRLSMSDNWEFALSRAAGKFINYIGDDDGFLPGALSNAMGALSRSNYDALIWEKIEYCWPDYIENSMRNWFSLKTASYSMRTTNARSKLAQVIKFRDSYTKLPCLYNGIVRKALIDKVRDQSTSKMFFNAIAPDVYSGIVLSMAMKSYLYTNYPFSINGASRHSNGTSTMRQGADTPNSSVSKFSSENRRIYDDRIRIGPSAQIYVMGEYLLASTALPNFHFSEPPWKHYVAKLVKSAEQAFLPNDILESASHTARALGINMSAIKSGPRKLLAKPTAIGMDGGAFSFIVPIEMVSNVNDACKLVAGMLPAFDTVRNTTAFGTFIREIRKSATLELLRLYRSF